MYKLLTSSLDLILEKLIKDDNQKDKFKEKDSDLEKLIKNNNNDNSNNNNNKKDESEDEKIFK